MDRTNRKAGSAGAGDNVLRPDTNEVVSGALVPLAPVNSGVGKTKALNKGISFEAEVSVTFTDVLAALDAFGADCSGLNRVGATVDGTLAPNRGGISTN
jgi:hypothetical protein